MLVIAAILAVFVYGSIAAMVWLEFTIDNTLPGLSGRSPPLSLEKWLALLRTIEGSLHGGGRVSDFGR